MGIGLAALAGVPPLIGFFTKDTVIDAALEGATGGGGARAWLVVVALFVTVVLTAAYCARAWLLLDTPLARAETGTGTGTDTDTGSDTVQAAEQATAGVVVPETVVVDEQDLAVVTVADSADDAEVERVHAHGHAAITLSAALSVALLAALTVVGTLLLTSLRGAIHVGAYTALLSVLLVVGTAYAVWTVTARGRHDIADRVPSHLRDSAVRGFGVDTAYVGVGRAVTAVARLVVLLDRDVVDAYPRASVVAARGLGRAGERSHRGVPSLSLVALLAGVVGIAVLGVTAWR
jgi:NADH-quinone oxidoreductase subunit L